MIPLAELKLIGIAGLLIALLVGYTAWAHKLKAEGRTECRAAQAVADNEARAEATRLTNRAAADQQGIQDAKDAQLRDSNARLVSALAELRNRPARHGDLPAATASACTPATGRELYREDAEFLSREAARADELRIQLGACQEREQSNFRALNGDGGR